MYATTYRYVGWLVKSYSDLLAAHAVMLCYCPSLNYFSTPVPYVRTYAITLLLISSLILLGVSMALKPFNQSVNKETNKS